MGDNKQAYSTEKVVSIYTKNFRLITAEDVLIHKYRNELKSSIFLDIGIGGGRTTHFFAPLVRKYFGVDYSTLFVDHVANEHRSNEKVVIEFGDARELKKYPDGSFDFILFSFNGIDCVGFEDRKKILSECYRLLKPKGHFWFSFHNIYSLPKLYSFQWPKNPFNWPKEWKRSATVKKINGDRRQYEDKDYCILRDGADFFETEVMYLKPSVQINLLREAGFGNVQLYHAQNGKPISETEATHRDIDWIYADSVKP